MAEFVTADLHFGDKRMLGLGGLGFIKRPFDSIISMNDTLIENWNSMVASGDTVYVLGDVFAEKTWRDRRFATFTMLNGRKILVRGNHDDRLTMVLGWVSTHNRLTIERGGVSFVMQHYPKVFRSFRDARSVVHLHGHIHSKEASMPIYDVGVDAHDLKPVPMDELVAKALRHRQAIDTLAALQEQED